MDDDERLLLRLDGRADGRADGWMDGSAFSYVLGSSTLFSLVQKKRKNTRASPACTCVCVMTGRSSIYYPTHVVVIVVVVVVVAARSPMARSAFPF